MQHEPHIRRHEREDLPHRLRPIHQIETVKLVVAKTGARAPQVLVAATPSLAVASHWARAKPGRHVCEMLQGLLPSFGRSEEAVPPPVHAEPVGVARELL